MQVHHRDCDWDATKCDEHDQCLLMSPLNSTWTTKHHFKMPDSTLGFMVALQPEELERQAKQRREDMGIGYPLRTQPPMGFVQ